LSSITRTQWFAIGILFCTVITGGTAQLVDLVGPSTTKIMVSLCTLTTGFLAGIQIILGGQAQQIKDVAAMPGVDRIALNANASLAAAQVATDPAQQKVGATDPGTRQALQATVAKG
jgi:hypothetical protein